MSTFGWIMLALGLFLVLYTVAFLVRPKGSTGRDGLGCGFVLLAGLVWSIALAQYVGSRGAGLRLGFGAALILPALVALFKAGRARIVPAALCFIAGILVASSALPALKQRVKPSEARSQALDMTKGLDALRAQVQKRETHLADLAKSDAKLKAELKALDVADFEAAMANPEGKRVIEELAEVKRLREAAQAKLDKERTALKKLESELRRAERRARADALAQDEPDNERLAELIGDDEVTSPVTVEDHAAREEMRDLFNAARE